MTNTTNEKVDILKILQDEITSLPTMAFMASAGGSVCHVDEAVMRLTAARDEVIDLTAERDTLKALCVELADALFSSTATYGHTELLTRARSILK